MKRARTLWKLARNVLASSAQTEQLPPTTLPSPAERRFEEASQGAKPTRTLFKWTWRW